MKLENTICPVCKKENNGSGYGDGKGGLLHSWCYHREYPPRTAKTLYEMARGCGDPVLAAKTIAAMVPAELAGEIVETFNTNLLKQWQRRCEEEKYE